MIKRVFKFCMTCILFATILTGCSYNSASFLASLKPKTHTVRSKETVYALSRKYNVPTRRIIEANNLQPPYSLKKGQKLLIPRAQIHTVQKGDTLYNIARTYGIDFTALAKQNKIKEPWTLSVGQHLYLPATLTKVSYADIDDTPASKTNNETIGNNTSKSTSKKKFATPLPATPKLAGSFMWPVQGKVISNFGVSGNGHRNDGINIQATEGTPFKSVENGVVAYAGNELKSFGNLVLIKHSNGWVSAYAHAKDLKVSKGATVKKGDVLGLVGKTGNVKTSQLHFEIRKGTKATDPMNYLKR